MKTPGKGQPGKRRNQRDQRGPRGQHGTGRPPRQDQGRRGRSQERRGPRQQSQKPAAPQRPRISGDLVYGRNAVRESLRANRREAKTLYIADGVRDDDRVNEIVSLAQEQEAMIDRIPRPMLDDMTAGGNHQGVALEAGEYPYVDLEDVIERDGTVLVMDHLNDPQNFGTLMRAADAFGVAGIVIPQDRSVSVTPAVVNASAGAIEHVMVALTPNLARALDKLEASGRWIIGLDEDEEPTNLVEAEIPTPVALVLGAEGSGLSPVVRKRCQMIVSIPMQGHVDSLNAATAGTILLYDLKRRELSSH